MNYYIVRVYRQEVDSPGEFVGIVEEVGVDGQRAFTDINELWAILSAGKVGKQRGDTGEQSSCDS